MKNIEKFSLYLFHNLKINSNLKIQKILFFLRVYEKIHSIENSQIFEENNNFQAWIYGPVNIPSYYLINNYLNEYSQMPDDILIKLNNEYTTNLSKYISIANKLNKYNVNLLVDLTHNNISYIKARNGIDKDAPCCNFINEENDDFTEFSNKDRAEFSEIITLLSENN